MNNDQRFMIFPFKITNTKTNPNTNTNTKITNTNINSHDWDEMNLEKKKKKRKEKVGEWGGSVEKHGESEATRLRRPSIERKMIEARVMFLL